MCVLVTELCPTLQSHGLYLARLLCPWNSPGKNTGVGCHSLLQEVESRSPELKADSLQSESPRKPPFGPSHVQSNVFIPRADRVVA